jgi:hypothetical protein
MSAKDQYANSRIRDWEMLIIATLVLVASLLLDVKSGAVHLPVAALPLPPLCMSKELFGMDCPGCGLTRSFVHLAHGRWTESWQAHRLGWLLAALLLAQIPYRALRLNNHEAFLSLAVRRTIGNTLILLLIGNWVVGFFLPAMH